jgi:hypothetical protein
METSQHRNYGEKFYNTLTLRRWSNYNFETDGAYLKVAFTLQNYGGRFNK